MRSLLPVLLMLSVLATTPFVIATDCPYNAMHCQSRIKALAGGVTYAATASASLDAEIETTATILSVTASATGELTIFVEADANITGASTVSVGVNETQGVNWTSATLQSVTLSPTARATSVAFPFTVDSDVADDTNVFVPFRLDAGNGPVVGHLVFATPTTDVVDPPYLGWLIAVALGALLGALVMWFILRK